jgi:hypothetical protein
MPALLSVSHGNPYPEPWAAVLPDVGIAVRRLGVPANPEFIDNSTAGLRTRYAATMMLFFFESHKNEIVKAFGKKQEIWPDPWGFAWVARNAFVHDGKAETDKDFHWHGLHYGEHNRGRDIINVDLRFTEFVILTLELYQALVQVRNGQAS